MELKRTRIEIEDEILLAEGLMIAETADEACDFFREKFVNPVLEAYEMFEDVSPSELKELNKQIDSKMEDFKKEYEITRDSDKVTSLRSFYKLKRASRELNNAECDEIEKLAETHGFDLAYRRSLPEELTEMDEYKEITRKYAQERQTIARPLTEKELEMLIKISPDGLTIEDCLITSLPNNLNVQGNLIIKNCEYLTGLPNDLSVQGDLSIYDTPIQALSETSNIKGAICLDNTAIESVTDRTINGNLRIENSPIKTLNNLNVLGEVRIDHLPLKELNNFSAQETMWIRNCNKLETITNLNNGNLSDGVFISDCKNLNKITESHLKILSTYEKIPNISNSEIRSLGVFCETFDHNCDLLEITNLKGLEWLTIYAEDTKTKCQENARHTLISSYDIPSSIDVEFEKNTTVDTEDVKKAIIAREKEIGYNLNLPIFENEKETKRAQPNPLSDSQKHILDLKARNHEQLTDEEYIALNNANLESIIKELELKNAFNERLTEYLENEKETDHNQTNILTDFRKLMETQKALEDEEEDKHLNELIYHYCDRPRTEYEKSDKYKEIVQEYAQKKQASARPLTSEEANALMEKNNGNLDLSNCTLISALPDDLHVHGDLILTNSNVECLNNIQADGFLNVTNCENLKTIKNINAQRINISACKNLESVSDVNCRTDIDFDKCMKLKTLESVSSGIFIYINLCGKMDSLSNVKTSYLNAIGTDIEKMSDTKISHRVDVGYKNGLPKCNNVTVGGSVNLYTKESGLKPAETMTSSEFEKRVAKENNKLKQQQFATASEKVISTSKQLEDLVFSK